MLLLKRKGVSSDLFQRADWLRLVEEANEDDLVANPCFSRAKPRVAAKGRHVSLQEGIDAAPFLNRDLLGVT